MSGYLTVRQALSLQKEDAAHPSWRADSVMHQLSMNGSLLLAPNHDKVWLQSYREIAGGEKIPWEIERNVLLALPAWTVRRTLWRASFDWWLALMSYRKRLSQTLLDRGMITHPEVDALDVALGRTALQLGELAWCAKDSSTGRISVVEEEEG